jgi:hypothetical protein
VREDGTVGKEASLVVDVSITGRLWEQFLDECPEAGPERNID